MPSAKRFVPKPTEAKPPEPRPSAVALWRSLIEKYPHFAPPVEVADTAADVDPVASISGHACDYDCKECHRVLGDLDVERCPKCPPEPKAVPCPECRIRPGRTSFGLCKFCYKGLSAEERAKRGRRDRTAPHPDWLKVEPPPSPPAATKAMPGSYEKLRVLRDRVKLGLEPWHPADPSKDLNYTQAFIEIQVSRADGHGDGGVHWCPDLRKFRAYPWWTLKRFRYKRFHLGYYVDRADAIQAVWKWRSLAAQVGPKAAMLSIRAERQKNS